MSDMEAKAPGLFVAGHARDGISLGDSIVSGPQRGGKNPGVSGLQPPARRRPQDHPVSA
jgi:hypothetical protein